MDSAFGLSTKLIKKKEEIISVTKINEGANITKTNSIWKNETWGDTIILNNCNSQNLVDHLNNNFPFLFFSTATKQIKYDMSLVLNKNSTSKEQIVQLLNKQGIDSKIRNKNVPYLKYLPENDAHRQQYIDVFKSMAQALIKLQRTDGFWNVSLFDPTS